MPIYEYSCSECDETFEALAATSAADAPRECPRCGLAAPRIISACTIGAAPAARGESASLHRRGRAPRPAIPAYARPCWMDDRSAERFGAYKMGRGAEYDDKAAAREERRKQRGLPAEESHDSHSHSPVAEILARKKAQNAAKAASADAAPANPTPANRAEPRPSN